MKQQLRARIAITREVAPQIVDCELTHLERQPIDYIRAVDQHRQYCRALSDEGLEVVTLPHASFPDGVFVEDPAIVVEELAVICRMGVSSRQAEVESLGEALQPFRDAKRLQAPGTLEGGDVLRIGSTLYVGLSQRTNEAGASQLGSFLEPYGYRVVTARAHGCLHFKSGCSDLGDGVVLVNPGWVDPGVFAGLDHVAVDPSEPGAANALRVNDTVFFPAAFPRTLARVRERGFRVRVIDNSELMKAESALTCMSQILYG